MQLRATLCGISLVVCVFLDASQGAPQISCQQALPILVEEIEEIACPCQEQVLPSPYEFTCPCQQQVLPSPLEYQQAPVFSPPSPPSCEYPSPPAAPLPNAPCTNCEDYYQSVPTLDVTLPGTLGDSPFYLSAVAGISIGNQIDTACYTYFPVNGLGLYIQFVYTTFYDGSYSVSTVLISDTEQAGVFRLQGLENGSGVSTTVSDSLVYGSVSCPNCSSAAFLTTIYSAPIFTDCSLLEYVPGPSVYALSTTPDVSPACLGEATALFGQAGFPACDVSFPLYQQTPMCVTSFNGAPCINANLVPACSRVAYPPPPPCGCAK